MKRFIGTGIAVLVGFVVITAFEEMGATAWWRFIPGGLATFFTAGIVAFLIE